MRIFDLTIYTTKFKAIKSFYSRLGFDVVHEIPQKLVVYDLGGAELAFHTADKDTSGLSISVISEDLDSLIEKLKKDGILIGEERLIHANFSGIEVNDPQGNLVYVFRDK